MAGYPHLHKGVFDRGLLDGTNLGQLHRQDLTFVVPAKANMAVTVDTQGQAAAGPWITMGRDVHTVPYGQG
jgi:hypothetical protein